jgi:tetratricopeptide (TPR) repeat protein
MRVLVGHINDIPQVQQNAMLPGREQYDDEIVAYGRSYPQFHYEPGMPWSQLLANCPQGWRPDVYIHWSPEYNAVPLGLEQADCLTVGVFGDWNLGGQAIHCVAGMFDVLVADRNGCEMLRQAGYDNVLYARLWAYNPDLHRREEGGRDLDIVMLGSLNHAVQARRARWLARVARLSTRYRVMIACGLHGEEYTRTLNRAKIVFNHCVRGEINMRAYEAPACGALLFNEADNAEIRDIYTDRVDCVLYDEHNLEALVDYYLDPANTQEREAIAQAGWEQVQTHTYARHFAELLTQLEPQAGRYRHDPATARSQRAYCPLPPYEKTIRLATHWLLSTNRQVYPRIDQLLMQTETEQSRRKVGQAREQAEITNLRAALTGECARAVSDTGQRDALLKTARAHAERAVKLAADFPIGRFNLANLQTELGLRLAGETTLRHALQQFTACTPQHELLRGVAFPRTFTYFDVTRERIWNTHRPGSPEWAAAMRELYLAQIHLKLALLAYRREDWAAATEQAGNALRYAPDMDEAVLARARALRAQGRITEAVASYRRTLELMPFIVPAWEELANLYADSGNVGEAVVLLEEWLAITAAFPMYAELRPHLVQMRDQARRQAQQGAPPPAPGITRLLACPDWHRPDSWQPLVRAFAATFGPHDHVVLLLRVDPAQNRNSEQLLAALQTFLLNEPGISRSALPGITLLNQALEPTDRWKLVYVADALLTVQPLFGPWRQLAEAANKPIYTIEELRTRFVA